jgi:hypothetical protein
MEGENDRVAYFARRVAELGQYPFFNGLAFLALYVVTYGDNEFMKPDE